MKKNLTLFFACIITFLSFTSAQSQDWVKSMGGTSSDGSYGIAVDDSGYVYHTGNFGGAADFDPGPGVYGLVSNSFLTIYVQKLDPNGNMVWAKQIGGDTTNNGGNGRAIAVDDSGNVYVTGSFFGTVDFDPDTGRYALSGIGFQGNNFILKLDSQGNLCWVKQLYSTGGGFSNEIMLDDSGYVYTLGSYSAYQIFDPSGTSDTLPYHTNPARFLLKLDASGHLIWGHHGEGLGEKMFIDDSSHIYITGVFYGRVDFDPGPGVVYRGAAGESGVYMLKLDTSGDFHWAKSIGRPPSVNGGMAVGGIVANDSGEVYITGTFTDTTDFDPGPGVFIQTVQGVYNDDIFILKLDAAGDFMWAKHIGNSGNERVYDMAVNSQRSIFLSGQFSGMMDFDPNAGVYWANGFASSFILKLDVAGNFLLVTYATGSESRGHAISVDKKDNAYTSGLYYNQVNFNFNGNNGILQSNGSSEIFVQKRHLCSHYYHTIRQSLCQGDSILFGGNYYQTTGRYYDTLTHTGVCDSFVVLDLIVNQPQSYTDYVSTCDSFTWIDGVTYTQSNQSASIRFTDANGCDSTIFLNLHISYTPRRTDVIAACDSFTWINGITYYSSNHTATHIMAGAAANGCDSIVQLQLELGYTQSGTDVITACDSFTWIDGITYYSDNQTATARLAGGAASGCDSIVTLDLVVLHHSSGTDVVTACDAYTWIDGNTYYGSNNTATHRITGGAANGCDSLVSLHLTIQNSAQGADIVKACNAFTWIDGITYTRSNFTASHTLTGGAANGCDSTVRLALTISSIDTSVTDSSPTLLANAVNVTYQWLDCTNGFAPIAGATAATFTPTYNGSFAVAVQNSNCTDTSSCYLIGNVGLKSQEMSQEINIYPNPTHGRVYIDPGNIQEPLCIRIYNAWGQLIQEKTFTSKGKQTIELTGAAGLYFIEISTKKGIRTVKKIWKK